jgi:hypothetical protein
MSKEWKATLKCTTQAASSPEQEYDIKQKSEQEGGIIQMQPKYQIQGQK